VRLGSCSRAYPLSGEGGSLSRSSVLITGGAGFIGSRLAARLVRDGHSVTVLDNLSSQVHGEDVSRAGVASWLPKEVRFVLGDVREPDAWAAAYSGEDIVIHLAAETGTGQSMYQAHRYCDVNINGTARLIDLLTAGKHNIEKVVVASSRSIYGEGKYVDAEGRTFYPGTRSRSDLLSRRFEPHIGGGALSAVATDEESKIHPSSLYGVTKATQEQLVLESCRALGIGAAGLRYQNVYGPGQSLKNPYTGILSIFSNLMLSGAAINVFEDGLESRDFVFVDDVVNATVLAALSEDRQQEYYNVGSGVPTNVLTVVHELGVALGLTPVYEVTGQFRAGDIRHNWADTRKVRERLGFTAQVSFTEGVRALCEWARSQERSDVGSYRKSLTEMRAKGLME